MAGRKCFCSTPWRRADNKRTGRLVHCPSSTVSRMIHDGIPCRGVASTVTTGITVSAVFTHTAIFVCCTLCNAINLNYSTNLHDRYVKVLTVSFIVQVCTRSLLQGTYFYYQRRHDTRTRKQVNRGRVSFFFSDKAHEKTAYFEVFNALRRVTFSTMGAECFQACVGSWDRLLYCTVVRESERASLSLCFEEEEKWTGTTSWKSSGRGAAHSVPRAEARHAAVPRDKVGGEEERKRRRGRRRAISMERSEWTASCERSR